MGKITYDDKIQMNENADIPAVNKGRAVDWNEIKNVINNTLFTSLGLDTDNFSTSTTYAIGDLVIYDNKIYKFTSTHTGDWDASDVSLVPIIEEV